MFYKPSNLSKLIDPTLREREVLDKMKYFDIRKGKDQVYKDLKWFGEKLQ